MVQPAFPAAGACVPDLSEERHHEGEGEGWAYYMEESSTGTVETHSTEMSDSSVRGSPPCLDHTYYSIQDTSAGSYRDMSGGGVLPALHHYHTLEPGQGAPPLFTIVTDPRRSVL